MTNNDSRFPLGARSLCWVLLAALAPLAPASAELAVSQLIVELRSGSSPTADIEILNDSPDRSFVAIEPREILDPGEAPERSFVSPDPEKLGLITSPARMVLEPHQRRLLRIAVISAESSRERVYRITIRPVAGTVTSEQTGLKLLVGYDLLVLVRPSSTTTELTATREGNSLVLVNRGNASVELAEGKQCDEKGRNCQSLPSKRLYAGASWRQQLPRPAKGEYRVRSADGWSALRF